MCHLMGKKYFGIIGLGLGLDMCGLVNVPAYRQTYFSKLKLQH